MNYRIITMFLITIIILTMFNINMVFAINTEEDNDATKGTILTADTTNTTNGCDILITGDKTEIKPGESVVYEIKATNIKGGGIIMFEASISYMDTIFNCNLLEDNENWINLTNLLGETDNVSYIMMQRKGLEASAEDQIVAKIKLTAKTDSTDGIYPINFTNIKFTGENDISFNVDDQTKDIKIVKDTINESIDNTNQDSHNENDNSTINVEEQSKEKNNPEDNTNILYIQDISKASSGNLPYTGITEVCITLIIIITIIAFIFYKKYKKWENI